MGVALLVAGMIVIMVGVVTITLMAARVAVLTGAKVMLMNGTYSGSCSGGQGFGVSFVLTSGTYGSGDSAN